MDSNLGMPMHAQILAADAGGGAPPSTQPAVYEQMLAEAHQMWAAEDAQIASARQHALWQAVMEACAPGVAPAVAPVAPIAGPDDAMVG